MRIAGRQLRFAAIVATLFVPPGHLIVPAFLIVDTLNWLDTPPVVTVPSTTGGFGVFFMRQFFISLHRELEEMAILDGASRWQMFTRVVPPPTRALATLGTLSFLTNWNDFL